MKELKEDLVLESYEEHSLAELGLKRLLATAPMRSRFRRASPPARSSSSITWRRRKRSSGYGKTSADVSQA